MADQAGIAEAIRNIQDDMRTIVKGELELAKAELLPQAKSAGIGAGLFGAAGYLAITGAGLLFCGLSFWWSVGYQSWFGLDLLTALVLGFVTMAVLLFLVAGTLALIGKQRLTLPGPQETAASAQESVAAVKGAIAQAKQRVEATSIFSGVPERKELL